MYVSGHAVVELSTVCYYDFTCIFQIYLYPYAGFVCNTRGKGRRLSLLVSVFLMFLSSFIPKHVIADYQFSNVRK